MRMLDSVILKAADQCSVPAGGALAVDRHEFAGYVTETVKTIHLWRLFMRKSQKFQRVLQLLQQDH